MTSKIEFPVIPTLNEVLSWGNDVEVVIDKLLALTMGYLSKPDKPFGKTNTAQEMREMADKMEVYEAELKEYSRIKDTHRAHDQQVRDLIAEYIKYESGLNEIPEQYRGKVYKYADDKTDTGEYIDLYYELFGLVDIFK